MEYLHRPTVCCRDFLLIGVTTHRIRITNITVFDLFENIDLSIIILFDICLISI